MQGLGDRALFKLIPAKTVGIERLEHPFPCGGEFLAQVFCADFLFCLLADKAVPGHAGAVPLSSDLRKGCDRLFLLLFGLLQGLFQFLCLAYSGGKIPCKTLHVFPCCIPCIREFGVWLGRRIFLCECLRLRAKFLQTGEIRNFSKSSRKARDGCQLIRKGCLSPVQGLKPLLHIRLKACAKVFGSANVLQEFLFLPCFLLKVCPCPGKLRIVRKVHAHTAGPGVLKGSAAGAGLAFFQASPVIRKALYGCLEALVFLKEPHALFCRCPCSTFLRKKR